jgi:resuscitation-promoting factor RpfA
MTSTTGRHARPGQAARKLIIALALIAGITIAAGAAAAVVISLAGAPVTVTVPGAQSHAAVRAHHHAAPVPPEAHKAVRAVWVTVRPGQCLSVIAAAHGISWHALYRANRREVGSNPDLIFAGMRLRVPRR